MAREAQILANRLNARKSTGPRTSEGKAVVAQNAVTHGLLAQQAVILGKYPGEFEFYRDQMLGELSPPGAMESMLAERVVGELQRLRLLRELDRPLAQPTPEPAAPVGEEQSCETKPISGHISAETPACARPRADKGRSCLTRGPGLSIIPHSDGPENRYIGFPVGRFK